jgi:hypothetical protein
MITPYTAPIKLQVVQLHLRLHLFNHLEQVQKRPTQSPATAVRNILIPRFSQNPCASCDLLKTSTPLAIFKELGGSRAFIRNSALSWKSLRLLRFLQKLPANQTAALLSYRIFSMIFACENLLCQ